MDEYPFPLHPLKHQPSGHLHRGGPRTGKPSSAGPAAFEPAAFEPAAPELRAYGLGRPAGRKARRLHLNEFRGELPESVRAAADGFGEPSAPDYLPDVAMYSPGPDEALATELARYVGAPDAGHVLLAGGSDEVLRAVIDAAALRGLTAALVGVPGYTHFEHYAALRGLEVVTYAVGLGTPPAALEAALRYHEPLLAAGCLVYLCSPNNPTGDMWATGAVARLAAEHPDSLFLIDEAYVEFASVEADELEVLYGLEEPCVRGRAGPLGDLTWGTCAAALNAASLAPLACRSPNIVVSRTFSKAFGLAALRVGYAVGRPDVIRAIRVAPSPKAVSGAAVRAARAALRELPYYLLSTVRTREDARAVVRDLRSAGWFVRDTPGNFFLVHVGAPSAPVVEALASAGVLVRDRGGEPGLAGFVRVTAGTDEDNEAVLEAFAGLVRPADPPPQALYTDKGAVAALKKLTRTALLILDPLLGTAVWAQGGTLLGMVRHRRPAARPLPPAADSGPLAQMPPGRKDRIRWRGGIVPWDDDVDLAYLRRADQDDPLAKLVGIFATAGLTLQRNRTDAYWQVGTNAPGEPISPVHIDIFSYSGSPAAGYALDDERFRDEDPASPQAHCNTRYAYDELFPFRTDHAFYDLPLAIPARAEAVLERALGPDYMSVARMRTAGGAAVAFPLTDLSPA